MEELIPTEYYLRQNYPNPFNEKTIIKYCLPEKVKVKIAVFCSSGEFVKEFINQVQDEGTYQIEFNGKYCEKENTFISLKPVIV